MFHAYRYLYNYPFLYPYLFPFLYPYSYISYPYRWIGHICFHVFCHGLHMATQDFSPPRWPGQGESCGQSACIQRQPTPCGQGSRFLWRWYRWSRYRYTKLIIIQDHHHHQHDNHDNNDIIIISVIIINHHLVVKKGTYTIKGSSQVSICGTAKLKKEMVVCTFAGFFWGPWFPLDD